MVYVQAANQISLQAPLSEEWMESPVVPTEPFTRSQDPDFREFVAPAEGRRMGKLLKRALATSLKTLRACQIEHPDAIITGTGLGNVESTELFLLDLCQQGEQLLKPTHFMQSTHNTIGSLVAIQTKSHGYNATYSHKGISFESALYDAFLQLSAREIRHALVLGQDGLTPNYHHLLGLSGFAAPDMAVTSAEASVAALLNDSEENALCRVEGVWLLHRPDEEDWRRFFSALALPQDTLVLSGENGSVENDALYADWHEQWCPGLEVFKYKELFGESFSASALGFYASAHLIHAGRCPRVLLVNMDRAGDAAITYLSR